MDFLQGAGVREGKEELQAIATRLWLADLDQSILGELTREWLSAEDLKLSLGQQMKILRHVPTYRRSQRIPMTPITLITPVIVKAAAFAPVFAPVVVKATPKAAAKAAGGHGGLRGRGSRVPPGGHRRRSPENRPKPLKVEKRRQTQNLPPAAAVGTANAERKDGGAGPALEPPPANFSFEFGFCARPRLKRS